MKAICTLYQEAPRLATEGEQSVSTDELTGVQALERKHPGLPLAPGKAHELRNEIYFAKRSGSRPYFVAFLVSIVKRNCSTITSKQAMSQGLLPQPLHIIQHACCQAVTYPVGRFYKPDKAPIGSYVHVTLSLPEPLRTAPPKFYIL